MRPSKFLGKMSNIEYLRQMAGYTNPSDPRVSVFVRGTGVPKGLYNKLANEPLANKIAREDFNQLVSSYIKLDPNPRIPFRGGIDKIKTRSKIIKKYPFLKQIL